MKKKKSGVKKSPVIRWSVPTDDPGKQRVLSINGVEVARMWVDQVWTPRHQIYISSVPCKFESLSEALAGETQRFPTLAKARARILQLAAKHTKLLRDA